MTSGAVLVARLWLGCPSLDRAGFICSVSCPGSPAMPAVPAPWAAEFAPRASADWHGRQYRCSPSGVRLTCLVVRWNSLTSSADSRRATLLASVDGAHPSSRAAAAKLPKRAVCENAISCCRLFMSAIKEFLSAMLRRLRWFRNPCVGARLVPSLALTNNRRPP